MANAKYSGRCLCSKIQFQVSGFSSEAAHCHCSMCQKFHGSAFATLVAVKDLEWRQGVESLKSYQASNGVKRYFCEVCGSSLAFLAAGAEDQDIELAIACFDQQVPINIDAHIFLSSKVSWHEITDSLPKFDHGRDGDLWEEGKS